LRAGPCGSGVRAWRKGLTLRSVRAAPHGIDLGPMEPALPGRLPVRGDGSPRRIELAPPELVADAARLEASLGENPADLVLIGRRDILGINSWTHNLPSLARGRSRCVLQMHPADAAARGIARGDRVRLSSHIGTVVVDVELTEDVMRGVLALPHGYGHDRAGTRLGVARVRAGASFNDLTDPADIDPLSGNAVLNGIPVRVAKDVEHGGGFQTHIREPIASPAGRSQP